MVRIMPTSRTCLDILVLVFSAALIYSWIILGGKDVEQRVVDKENIVRDTETAFDSFYLKSNVLDLISIDSFEKVETKRKQLIEFLWGQSQLPGNTPAKIENNYKDQRYEDVRNLERIDRLSIEMEYGWFRTCTIFSQGNPMGRLFCITKDTEVILSQA